MADQITEDENDELLEEWSHEELVKRSQELQLLDGNGHCIISAESRRSNESTDRNRLFPNDGNIAEFDEGSKSASTTSDSQVSLSHFIHHHFKSKIIQISLVLIGNSSFESSNEKNR